MKKETKSNLKKVGLGALAAAGAIGSFVLGGKYKELCITRGLAKAHDVGVLKFFNKEGGEIDVVGAYQRLKTEL